MLVWIASHFHNGKEIANTSLQESAEKDDVNLLGRKWVFITYEHPPLTPTPQFEPLERHSGFYNGEVYIVVIIISIPMQNMIECGKDPALS